MCQQYVQYVICLSEINAGTKDPFTLQHHIVNYVIGLKPDFTIDRKSYRVSWLNAWKYILLGLHKNYTFLSFCIYIDLIISLLNGIVFIFWTNNKSTFANLNPYSTLTDSFKLPFFDFPFLLSEKSESPMYLWFDWFVKGLEILFRKNLGGHKCYLQTVIYELLTTPFFKSLFNIFILVVLKTGYFICFA